ncbi:MAG: FAD-dependent oxidoreductase [Pseudomonadota bacterium]
MKNHAKVVVVGGGVVGCSVAYHLTRHGWTDVVLLERSELTSGSSWHAAGGVHTINGDPNVAKLQKYTVELYREIQEYSGQDVGYHTTGGVLLAATPERFDWLKSMQAKGRYMGLEAELITPSEAAELFPLMDPDQFVGALYDPYDGHLDPSGATYAYAKSAKKNGAQIETHTKVEELIQLPDGQWRVVTEKGDIIAEHVVNAGGLWAREVGRMVGLELPLLAMEHMYLLTDDMPEVTEFNEKSGKEMLHAVDFDGELYMRQERKGMLLGTYERDCRPWSPHTTPWDFGHELLQPDIDRISPSLEVGFRHFPPFERAGIKQIINGPFTFAPDGNPLVGPVKGLPGFWSACAVMAGFSQGGGVGLALSNWMIDGDPGFDVFAMDISRFGDYASMAYTNAKVQENYARRFSIRFPNEELPAARPLKTSPIYSELKAAGAQFGAAHGLEVPLWFAPDGVEDCFSWRRSTDFEAVGAEAKAVRAGVGIIETTGFAKYTISGRDAGPWLDHILAGKLPEPGRMVLSPMLKQDGKLIGDFTLANLGDGRFFLVGSGVAEDYHMRWFTEHLSGDVQVLPHGANMCGLSIAGPRARDVLAALTRDDVGREKFRFMDIRQMDIAMAPALVGRVSFTGDLGYEIWMAPEYQRHIYQALLDKGAAHGIHHFGLRALNALRLEKSFGGWAREYRPIYLPSEAGLDRFVAIKKDADFIGKSAIMAAGENGGGPMRLKTFVVEAVDADVIGDEPIYHSGTVQGWVTSGGFAHASGVSVAMGYVPREIADQDEGWQIELLGELLPARLQRQPLFDANGHAMRS